MVGNVLLCFVCRHKKTNLPHLLPTPSSLLLLPNTQTSKPPNLSPYYLLTRIV